jgi:Cd2+/Zn2+-exporting ATPase
VSSDQGTQTISQDFPVWGLHCSDCAQLLEKAIGKLAGVTEVRADNLKSSLRVVFRPAQVPPEAITQAIRCAGYAVPGEAAICSTTFVIEGMDCAEEQKLITEALRDLPGIDRLEFFLISGTLRVSYDQTRVHPDTIMRAIDRAGFQATVKRAELAMPPWQGRRQLILLGLCGFLMALGFVVLYLAPVLEPALPRLGTVWGIDLSRPGPGQLLVVLLFSAAIIVGGYPTARKAWAAVRNLTPDMNLLMAVAVVGAVSLGEWTEAVAVVFLFSLAKLLQNSTLERARRVVRSLLDLSPKEATVRRAAGEITVPVGQVRLGETIVIRPGSKIPLDGEVIEGASPVNQAPITGESMPVEKGPADMVFAGSINGRSSLLVRVTHLAEDTTLARIFRLVEEAQAHKAPTQAFVERFARYYTPIVISAALVVMAAPPLIWGQPFASWLYRALVFLVISCPCALVISTPVAIVSGLARSARTGVLIKAGVHLENLAMIRAFAFDKTGTLTQGQPAVTRVVPLDGRTAREVLGVAAAVERRSEHHLAQAILARAAQDGIELSQEIKDCEAIPGKGIKAGVNGLTCYVGSYQMFTDLGLCQPELCAQAEALEGESQTVVVVGSSQGVMGLIVIEDGLRPEALEAVTRLRQAGIAKLVMLTGDNSRVALKVAKALNLDDYVADLMPADKVGAIKKLLDQEERVAMVGDGVNDAPALAAATLGIAMGAAGSDAAIEAADIALMADDLGKLPPAILLSRRVRRIIKVNIFFALATKGIFLLLATLGLATLWMAVFADTGTSIMVILNGLRLHTSRTD